MTSGRWGIQIREASVGRDSLFVVTGGEAHIGSVATAYFSETAKEVETQTIDVPGHREHELAAGMAKRASYLLRRTVTVAAGIHYDGISRDDIAEIVAEANSAFDEYLATMLEKVD